MTSLEAHLAHLLTEWLRAPYYKDVREWRKWRDNLAKRVMATIADARKTKKYDDPRPLDDINAEINNARLVLNLLLDERKGRMVDDKLGYCVGCGDCVVDTADGVDTCSACVEGA